jgi:hypothetical protein
MMMFYDVDIERMRKEQETDVAVLEQQWGHSEVAMGRNKALRGRCGALD